MEISQDNTDTSISPIYRHNDSHESMRANFYRSQTFVYTSEIFQRSVNSISTSIKFKRKKKALGRNDDKTYKKFRRLCKNIYLALDGEVLTKNKVLEWSISLLKMCNVFLALTSYILSTVPFFQTEVDSCMHPVCSSAATDHQCFCPPENANVFNIIELVCTSVFTLEFIGRIGTVWACNSREAKLVSYKWLENHTSIDIPPRFKTFYHFLKSYFPKTLNYYFPPRDRDRKRDDTEIRGEHNKPFVLYEDNGFKFASMIEKYFHFLTSFRSLIDFIIIVPFWITFGLYGFKADILYVGFVPCVRLFYVFRLFNYLTDSDRYEYAGLILIQTITRSGHAILSLMATALAFSIFFGSIMYEIELGKFTVNESWNLNTTSFGGAFLVNVYSTGLVPTRFVSIPASMYFIVTTITTTGYGDLYPTSYEGRLLSVLIMFCGTVFLALPIAVISANFNTLYKEFFDRLEIEEKEKEQLEQCKSKHEIKLKKREIRKKHREGLKTYIREGGHTNEDEAQNASKMFGHEDNPQFSSFDVNHIVHTSSKNSAKASSNRSFKFHSGGVGADSAAARDRRGSTQSQLVANTSSRSLKLGTGGNILSNSTRAGARQSILSVGSKASDVHHNSLLSSRRGGGGGGSFRHLDNNDCKINVINGAASSVSDGSFKIKSDGKLYSVTFPQMQVNSSAGGNSIPSAAGVGSQEEQTSTGQRWHGRRAYGPGAGAVSANANAQPGFVIKSDHTNNSNTKKNPNNINDTNISEVPPPRQQQPAPFDRSKLLMQSHAMNHSDGSLSTEDKSAEGMRRNSNSYRNLMGKLNMGMMNTIRQLHEHDMTNPLPIINELSDDDSDASYMEEYSSHDDDDDEDEDEYGDDDEEYEENDDKNDNQDIDVDNQNERKRGPSYKSSLIPRRSNYFHESINEEDEEDEQSEEEHAGEYVTVAIQKSSGLSLRKSALKDITFENPPNSSSGSSSEEPITYDTSDLLFNISEHDYFGKDNHYAPSSLTISKLFDSSSPLETKAREPVVTISTRSHRHSQARDAPQSIVAGDIKGENVKEDDDESYTDNVLNLVMLKETKSNELQSASTSTRVNDTSVSVNVHAEISTSPLLTAAGTLQLLTRSLNIAGDEKVEEVVVDTPFTAITPATSLMKRVEGQCEPANVINSSSSPSPPPPPPLPSLPLKLAETADDENKESLDKGQSYDRHDGTTFSFMKPSSTQPLPLPLPLPVSSKDPDSSMPRGEADKVDGFFRDFEMKEATVEERLMSSKHDLDLKEGLLKQLDDYLEQTRMELGLYRVRHHALLHEQRLHLKKIRSEKMSSQEKLFDIFDYNFDSHLGSFVTVVLIFFILLGIGAYIVSTMSEFQESPVSCNRPTCAYDPVLCPNTVICEPVPIPELIVIEIVTTVSYIVDFCVRCSLAWAVGPEKNNVSRYLWESQPLDNVDEHPGVTVAAASASAAAAAASETDINTAATTNFWTGSFPKNPEFGRLVFYLRYIFTVRSLIDLLCIIPSLIVYFDMDLDSVNLHFLRVFRVGRLFKLLLAVKSVRPMLMLLVNALDRSQDALILMAVVSSIVCIFFGSIVYSFEKGVYSIGYTTTTTSTSSSGSCQTTSVPYANFQVPNSNSLTTQESLFSSAAAGIYFAFYSVFTVGYGDLTPVTVGGRAFACCIMFVGVLLLALPIGVIGSHFLDLYRHEIAEPELFDD